MYQSWLSYLSGLVMPNQGNPFAMKEHSFLSKEEQKMVNELLPKILTLTSQKTYSSLSDDKELEAKFFKESINFWKEEFHPKIFVLSEKINHSWQEYSNQEQKDEESDKHRFFG